MKNFTALDEMKQHLSVLAQIPASGTPFISCYLNLESGPNAWRETLDNRGKTLRRILKDNNRADFDQVISEIERWLKANVRRDAKGVVIFARGTHGGKFLLPMQFTVPLPNLVTVTPTPNIYHLVELQDNYLRYVVLVATANRACILDVNLGAATILAWVNRPDIRTHLLDWAQTHFQANQANRGDRFLKEKVSVLEQLMHAGGHTRLILVGDHDLTRQVRDALPPGIRDRLMDEVQNTEPGQQPNAIAASLSAFLEQEELESRSIAERVIDGLRTGGLAVAGTDATMEALTWGEVDTLVIVSAYQPDPGWCCSCCRSLGADTSETSLCPDCEASAVQPIDVRETLVRLAVQLDCKVEVVERSDALMALGGVGCLLRSQRGHEMADGSHVDRWPLTSTS